jgi:hypothetical protein
MGLGEPAKWKSFSQTCNGRFLVLVAEETAPGIRPITGWPFVGGTACADTATTSTKPKTVTVTLSAADEARLRQLAKRQHVSKAQALKAIIGGALRPPARTARRKRAANA